MVEQIRLLQADIRDRIRAIEEAFEQIDKLGAKATGSSQDIVIGYYLHVLSGLFESLFEEIAETFGNHIADQSQWHSQLLRRMTLDVMPVRPPAISQDTYLCLNELRGFRHLFRNAYLLQFDPNRLAIVLQYAIKLRSTYRSDLDKFLDFLEQLIQTDT
jgi:hypothetical protein